MRGAALILIDVLNPLDFEGGRAFARRAMPVARRLAALKRRAAASGMPCLYVNDNHGRWRSDLAAVMAHSLRDDAPGAALSAQLRPEASDHVVLKPHQSGFYQTPLASLLDGLHVHTAVIGGLAGNMCVLFTAHDAYLRGLRVVVPSDCIASRTAAEDRYALEHLRRVMKATTTASTRLRLTELRRRQVSP